jgi:hypothetical protein
VKSYYTPRPKIDVKLTCKVCGREFTKTTTEDRAQVFKYCSEECKSKAALALRKAHRRVPKLRILGKCLVCGELFVFEDYVTSARQHYYCGKTCKIYAKWKARTKGDEVREKEAKLRPKPTAVVAGFYIPKGNMLNAYTLEDDPWKSGRLPKSVTENQVFS